MLDLLKARLQQGHRTTSFPKAAPTLPVRFRGLPVIDSSKCVSGCQECIDACPTEAFSMGTKGPAIDLGRCLFCRECEAACLTGVLRFSQDFRMATRTREALVMDGTGLRLAQALDRKSRALFGRSLKLRQVSAGGCNGCEGEVNVLSTVVFDIGRFGVQIVASPRHADGLLITGPVTDNMRLALQKVYEAVPQPKLVIAVGACAIGGGPFMGLSAVQNGAQPSVPVDLFVPGCPPHPYTILDGILRLLGRIGPEREPR